MFFVPLQIRNGEDCEVPEIDQPGIHQRLFELVEECRGPQRRQPSERKITTVETCAENPSGRTMS